MYQAEGFLRFFERNDAGSNSDWDSTGKAETWFEDTTPERLMDHDTDSTTYDFNNNSGF